MHQQDDWEQREKKNLVARKLANNADTVGAGRSEEK
jgi:hypothetical protein